MIPQWVVAGSANAGVFGIVRPVVLDTQIDPNDVWRCPNLWGPFETILRNSNATGWPTGSQQAIGSE